MLRNYIISAYRNILKNRLFAGINILGLAVGLLVYVMSQLIANYENTHDTFFARADRIHVLSAVINPARGASAKTNVGVHTTLAPLVREYVPAAEVTARLYNTEYLVRVGGKVFYQSIRFAEQGFLDIFDFEFIAGSAETALSDPAGLILTESTARKFFGDQNPMGQIITMDRNKDLVVTGLIRDLPKNSHFVSSLIFEGTSFEMIARDRAFLDASGFDADNAWGNMTSNFLTYSLLQEDASLKEADRQLADLFDSHFHEGEKAIVSGLFFKPLREMNLFPWETSGIPAIVGIQVLGVLVLIIACLNYTNLATAQVMGRTREVALRKTMGAGKKQLFTQFIVESVIVALAALLLAMGLIELILPIINDASGKAMSFGVFADPVGFARLALLVVAVGVASGTYPALIIARGGTVKMLQGEFGKGRHGNWLRSTLLVLQFTISIFMAVGVSIIYAQNQKIVANSSVFDKDQIVVIERVNQGGITEVWDTLRNEILRIPGVSALSFIGMPPFEQSTTDMTLRLEPGVEASEINVSYVEADESFLDATDMPLLAGRRLSPEIANDSLRFDENRESVNGVVNVLVNQTAARALSLDDPAGALGKSFYSPRFADDARQFRVVGIVPDVNYRGFQNRIRPLMFMAFKGAGYGNILVRIEAGARTNVVENIDRTWANIVPGYPIERRFLSEVFEQNYAIFGAVTGTMAGFASVALALALFGLFGLAAIMAAKRTREIGIRKVLGANTPDIVRLLVWQFSRPVVIGFVLAVPLGYFGAQSYLDYFADRVGLTPMPFLMAGLLALGLAWGTVAGHAIRVARTNPIKALRYE